uniref:Zf-BED domain-containing protein n=1 Tax=Tanacetum cinerariifolium TaxID=118510 RepID=A0A6L2MA84_TANCI|nr:zf-BED domain-containing protein [Tanacetum cinerariifolium]
MTKVIKGEFEKLEDLNDKYVSLTCDTSLKIFNNESNRMSRMDDDLCIYEVKVANIPCDSNRDDDLKQRMSQEADDDMRYDPSDITFTEWLRSKNFNYKTMDHYTKKALWIYWIRGDDEVELTDEEFSDNEAEVAEKNNGYCNGGNLLRAYIDGNSLHYQDYEWYEALMDSKLKEQALKTKAIMEGLISDDESSNDGWRRWESHEITYHDHDEIGYENETHDEIQDLCEAHKLSVYNIRKFKMIKYSFGQDEEYVAVKEDEYDDLARTSDGAYQEIFLRMDEGWMVTRVE